MLILQAASAPRSHAASFAAKPDAFPNFDLRPRGPTPETPPSPTANAALLSLRSTDPGLVVRFDPITRTPRWISKTTGFLTAPNGGGRLISPASLQRFPAADPHRRVKAFLDQHAALFGQDSDILSQTQVAKDYTTPGSGMRTVVWQQSLEDIPVFEGLLIAHETQAGELINVSSRLIPNLPGAATRSGIATASVNAPPTLSPEAALAAALQSLGTVSTASDFTPLAPPEGAQRSQQFNSPRLADPALVRLVWLPLDSATVQLCWRVELTPRLSPERFRLLVDTRTAQIWIQHRLTFYLESPDNPLAASYRVFTSDSPSPLSPGHPTPSPTQPPIVNRHLVTLAALSTNASPAGWIPAGQNETLGNNVHAHLDLNFDNQPDLPRPSGQPFRVFDFDLDLTKPPSAYRAAAVTQLFYWNNWMHDRLYDLGFTEAAGNFQTDNFNRGGRPGDPMLAEAQDGSWVNNASITLNDDGASAFMQMHIFDGPNPDRDSSLDAEIVLHEYTHGLSGRLVGGGAGITELQTWGMGEGWSDFFAIALLSEPDDDLDGTYASGAYSSHLLDGLEENYYFGIRRYPYSTDLTKNPLTFRDIDPDQAQPHTGVPKSPHSLPLEWADEVHAQGEVWCVTLWEARANLIRKHGFAVGNELILQLVVDGMKLSPPNPTFLEARDAIIQADLVRTGGANQLELWRAFAKRGMGFTALSPPVTTTRGLVEAHDLPDDLLILPIRPIQITSIGSNPLQPSEVRFELANAGANPIVWSILDAPPWLDLHPTQGSLEPGSTAGTLRASPNNLADNLPAGIHEGRIVITNYTTSQSHSRRLTLRINQPESFTQTYSPQNPPPSLQSITFTPDTSLSGYAVCTQPADRFHVDASNHPRISLGDEEVVELTLTNRTTLGLFGRRYASLFLASNGYITFTNLAPTYFVSLVRHFSTPRISALFDDFDPSRGGIVSWTQLQDRIVITFLDVPRWARADKNSFQTELFLDGRIRITLLNLGSQFAIIGLSRGGGIPTGYTPTSLDTPDACLPTIDLRLPLAAPEGAGDLPGFVHLPFPVSADTRVQLTPASPDLVPDRATVLIRRGFSSASFAVSLADNTLPDGTRFLRLKATSPGFEPAHTRIEVTDDETAVLTVEIPPSVSEGAGLLPNAGRLRLDPPPDRPILVSLHSTAPASLSVPPLVIVPANQASAPFDLTILDNHAFDSPDPVGVVASTTSWTPATGLTIFVDNEARSLTLELPVRIPENAGTSTNAGVVRIPGTLATDLNVRLRSSDPSLLHIPANVTIPRGQRSAEFDLAVTDDLLPNPPRSVTVRAEYPNFTAASGSIPIFDDERPPQPSHPTPATLTTNLPPDAVLSWNTGEGEQLANGNFESGLQPWTVLNGRNGGFELNDGTLDPPGPGSPTAPFEGKYNLVCTQSGPGTHSVHQEVRFSPDATSATLEWTDRIQNHADLFHPSEQVFRVEIRSTNDRLLATAFVPSESSPLTNDWTRRRFNLDRFLGQTVRVVFVVTASYFHLDVHLDDIRVSQGTVGDSNFDVLLATHPNLGPGDLQGATPSNRWPLPRLQPGSTYYWQIVARRGDATVPSPVWQFSTAPIGPLDHFAFDPIPSPQSTHSPVTVTIRALDAHQNPISDYHGTITVSGHAPLPPRSVGDPSSTNSVEILFGSTSSRTQIIYHPHELGDATRFTALSLEPLPTDYPFDGRLVVRIQPVQLWLYPPVAAWQPSGWTTVYEGPFSTRQPGWIDLPFQQPYRYEATLPLLIDLILINTNRFFSHIHLRSEPTEAPRSILPSRNTTLPEVSPLNWGSGASNPYAESHFMIPVLRLSAAIPTPFPPQTVGPFNQGIWTGDLPLANPAPNLILTATDPTGPSGSSQPFELHPHNDLALQAQISPSPVTVNDGILVTLNVTNSGPAIATQIVIAYDFPANQPFLDATASHGSFLTASNQLRWELDSLNPQTVATLAVRLQAGPDPGGFTHQARLVRPHTDSTPENDSWTSQVFVLPIPLVTMLNAFVDEGTTAQSPSNSVTNVTFQLRLSNPASSPVTIHYSTQDGSAQAPLDYTASTNTVTFLPGALVRNVLIPVQPDDLDETDETFLLNLSSATGAAVATPAAHASIVDDDGPTILIEPFQVLEGHFPSNRLEITLQLDKPSPQQIVAYYNLTPSTAVSGIDFDPASGSLLFPPRARSASIPIVIHGDRLREPDEHFLIQFSSARQASLSTNQMSVTLLNDDGVPGALDHFEFQSVTSTPLVGKPTTIQIAALDAFNQLVTEFRGPVSITAEEHRDPVLVGTNRSQWNLPFPSPWSYDSRCQILYTASELGGARWITHIAFHIVTPRPAPIEGWTLRLKHSPSAPFPQRAGWVSSGWSLAHSGTVRLQSAGWNSIQLDNPFQYDGTNHLLLDFLIDGSTFFSESPTLTYSDTPDRRTLWRESSTYQDSPASWGTNKPPARILSAIPNIRFESRMPLRLDAPPTQTFADGRWSGEIIFHEYTPQARLIATGQAGHSGASQPFNISAVDDLSLRSSISPTDLTEGEPFTVTAIIRNSGPRAATNVRLTHRTAPVSATLISGSASQGELHSAPDSIVANLGTLPPDSQATVTLNLAAPYWVGFLTNLSSITQAEPEPHLVNNHTTLTVHQQPAPLLSVATSSRLEGDTGESAISFTLQSTRAAVHTISVDVFTEDDSAKAGEDYRATTLTLHLPPGATSQPFTVPIIGDRLDEIDETFRVVLANAVNAVPAVNHATGRILDDDGPAISVSNIAVLEGDSGSRTARFPVTLDRPSPQPVFVSYYTRDGTALGNTDYTPAANALTFQPGVTNLSANVFIHGDVVREPDETLQIVLDVPRNASLAAFEATCTILNDDGIPGALDHFVWDPIPPLTYAGRPFAVGVTAIDLVNQPASNFTGTAYIQAEIPHPDITTGESLIPTPLPFDTTQPHSRLQAIYPAREVGPARQLTALALHVHLIPPGTLEDWTLRLRHTSLAAYPSNGVNSTWFTGFTTVFTGSPTLTSNGWITFEFTRPFAYNGSQHLMVDFSFRNPEPLPSHGLALGYATDSFRSLAIATNDFSFAPTSWFDRFPQGQLHHAVPNIHLSGATPINTQPGATPPLQFGRWTGTLQIDQPLPSVRLRARTPTGFNGVSPLFSIQTWTDSDLDGLPDDWELAHQFNPSAAGEHQLDPDNDGQINLHEFIAGTHPLDPSSQLHLTLEHRPDSTLTLHFQTALLRRYRLESTRTLTPTQWEPTGAELNGTGLTASLPITPTTEFQLYRVTVVPF